jgi:hypothetical protein
VSRMVSSKNEFMKYTSRISEVQMRPDCGVNIMDEFVKFGENAFVRKKSNIQLEKTLAWSLATYGWHFVREKKGNGIQAYEVKATYDLKGLIIEYEHFHQSRKSRITYGNSYLWRWDSKIDRTMNADC